MPEGDRRFAGAHLGHLGGSAPLVSHSVIIHIEDWRRQFETNLFGVLRVTQAALPSMRERQRGRILMMSSVAGLVTVPAQGAYSSSKHALEGLTNAFGWRCFRSALK